jgi:hypothetical protein
LIQKLPLVGCPEYTFEFWKALARSGSRDVYFLVPAGGSPEPLFRRDGLGPARTFRDWTHGRAGLFFFDTVDGAPPDDTNLAPGEIVVAGDWESRGFVYLNAERLRIEETTCLSPSCEIELRTPPEPFVGEPPSLWADLAWDDGASSFVLGDDPSWQSSFQPYDRVTNFRGILYTTGAFEVTGNVTFYGSVIARGGVTLEGAAEVFWDASILGNWPLEALRLPRTAVTSWRAQP